MTLGVYLGDLVGRIRVASGVIEVFAFSHGGSLLGRKRAIERFAVLSGSSKTGITGVGSTATTP